MRGHFDLEEVSAAKSASPWAKIIENLPGLKRKPKDKGRQPSGGSTLDSWKRFQVAYKRGITVVRLLEKALVKESQIRELARDLLDLIAAGNHRIVLNFQAIERLASWMAFVVDKAQKRCASGDGGGAQGLLSAAATVADVPDRRRGAGYSGSRRRGCRDRWALATILGTSAASDRGLEP